MTSSPLRVAQWTTGNVGRRSVLAVRDNPVLELVGCHACSPDKVGCDVSSLCGLDEPIGVTATDDVGAILALQPDCVVYNPKWPSVDELVAILEAGINVVTTAAFITGHALGADCQRVVDACERGHDHAEDRVVAERACFEVGRREDLELRAQHDRASSPTSTSPSSHRGWLSRG